MIMKMDITTQEDVKLLVDKFYDKVNADPVLGPILNHIAQVNWEVHLEKMYKFWGTMLLGEMSYKGSAFAVHEKMPIDNQHFESWIKLFTETVVDNFEGPNAADALKTAGSIALTFRAKLGLLK